MDNQTETEIHDQPTSGSWSEDWARAEQNASAYEETINGTDASEQERQQPTNEGADDDGAEDTEGGGGEEGLESSSEAEDREGESDLGPEDGEREGSDGDESQRDPSQSGRKQRELREQESPGPVDDDSPEFAEFKAQAEKLGFSIDGRQVAKQERVSLRQERKEMRARLADERHEVEQRLQQQASQVEQKYQRAMQLQKAIDQDDLNGVAEAIGYKDWTEINKAFLNKSLNPQHKEMMAMRRQLKEREERERQTAEAEQQRVAQERHAQQQREYKRDLQDDISDLEDETLSAFADDPLFVQAAFNHQQRNYDGVETISVQDAAKLAYDDAQKLWRKLNARFGGRNTQNSETPASGAIAEKPAGATGKRRKSPKTVSQSQVADASAQADPNVLDEKAWAAKWGVEIKNSTPSVG